MVVQVAKQGGGEAIENVVDEMPEQVAPPLAGAGLSQVRVLVRDAEPHVADQDDQAPQSDQAPSIGPDRTVVD